MGISVREIVEKSPLLHLAPNSVAQVALQRPRHYGNLVARPLYGLQERVIRTVGGDSVARRNAMVGAHFLAEPTLHLEIIRNEWNIGPYSELGSRAAGGLRKRLYRETTHGKNHEDARKGKNTRSHGEEHERRLRSWVREELSDPTLRLHSKLLYYVPDVWIHLHDGDQLDGEAVGLEKPKHGHDFAAALQTLVYTQRYQYESRLSQDEARLVMGVTAALMLYHDEPVIQQKLLHATEREDGAKPYEDLSDGTRRYYSAEELLKRMEDDKEPGFDLFALQDWQVAALTRLKKSQIEGLVTSTTSFGMDPQFELDFRNELAPIPIPHEGSLYLTQDVGDAHALVPEKLLRKMKPNQTSQFRIEAALMGDMLRIADQMDMIAPAALAMTRKWEVPISKKRPLARKLSRDGKTMLERVLSGKSKLDAEDDSDIGRGLWETYNALQAIRPMKGQLRQALEVSKTVRDRLYLLHIENIRAHKAIMPILMKGGRKQQVDGPIIPAEEQENRKVIEQAVRNIFQDDLLRMAYKFLKRAYLTEPSRHDNQTIEEYVQKVADLLYANGKEEYANHLADVQSNLNEFAQITMDNLDQKNSGEGLIPYSQEDIDEVIQTCEVLETLALEQYKDAYGKDLDIRDLPRPFRTYHSTAAGYDTDLKRVRTLRPEPPQTRRDKVFVA